MPVSAANITVLDALVGALKSAGEYNRNADVAPIAILWPDGAEAWRDVVPALRDHLTILTLGEYDATTDTGPAIWIRAELARRTSEDALPIVYLPGYSKDVLRHVEEAPNTIEPLVYLQYRGALFVQPNGKDLTISAFLQNAQFHLNLRVDRDEATRTSLISAAPKLLSQPVENLRNRSGGIDAEFLNSLLVADLPRTVLDWINDSVLTRQNLDDASWTAFSNQLRDTYKIDPDKDGPSAAARKLGEAKVGSHWDTVWNRFAESPRRYPNIPNMLRGAKPSGSAQRSLFEAIETKFHWPQDNEQQENALRHALLSTESLAEQDARGKIIALEGEHALRRSTVWAELGQTPLAFALRSLALTAHRTQDPFPAGSVATMQRAYTECGWEIDAAAIDAITDVETGPNREAINAALHAIYTPWLWKTAERFQEAIGEAAQSCPVSPLSVQPGTCVLFADGLRYDLAARLTASLTQGGVLAEIRASIGPLPGVTPSAKPAQSPVADRLIAGFGLDTRVAATGTALNQTAFRKLLDEAGWQVIGKDGTGKPGDSARAWTELGDIDSYGHGQTADLPRQTGREIVKLRERVMDLLGAGWQRVVIVTDHGWILTPRPMPKTELPQHLTAVRKGRCARLNDGATTHIHTVSWAWNADVRVAVAPGISCFEDGKRYEHGGLSLQECIVPTITVTGTGGGRASASVTIADASWRGLRCTVELEGASDGYQVDIRQRAGDASSSIVSSVKLIEEGGARVLVEDDIHEGTEAVLVILNGEGTPIAQRTLIVGEEGA